MSNHYSVNTLENGLKVVHVPFPGIDSAFVDVSGLAGSLWEDEHELGSAHFMEHMVFTGTKKYPSIRELRALISDIGAFSNGFTSFSGMTFFAKTLRKDMEFAFDYLSQLVLFPLIKDEDIVKQKGVISQELSRRLDNPVNNFYFNAHQNIMFQNNHRRSIPVLGTHKSINSISKDTLVKFHSHNFNANNFALTVCANVSKDIVIDLAKKYFSPMKSGHKNTFPECEIQKGLKIYSENSQKIKQSTIAIYFDAYEDFTPKSYNLGLISVVLGGDYNSRLMTEIRHKRGLAYTVSSKYRKFMDLGLIEISTQIDQKKVLETLKIIKKEINKIKAEKITEEEYAMVKNKIAAKYVFNNESSSKRTELYSDIVLSDKKEDYDSLLEKSLNVTREEGQEAAQETFSQEPKICVLSPNLTEEEIRKAWED